MPRAPRIDFPGAWHHVFDRGRARQTIFFDELSEIAGVSVSEMKRAKPGRQGNPAKRFAVWAIRERTRLSHAQIGKLLGMTASAVAKDLRKSRKHLAVIDQWSAQWLERHEEKFEVLLP